MSHAPTAALKRRHNVIRDALETHRVDALVITALPNILYLTNFTGSSAIVVLSADRLRFLTDSRYLTVVDETRGQAHECPGLEVVTVEGSYDAKLAEVLAGQGWTRVGFEATDVTVSRHAWLTSKLAAASSPVDLVPTEGVVERARVVKDDYEIATLREAGLRLSRVADEVPNEVKAGRTEREVAMAIDSRIREAGFSRTAFDTIVAGGPNAALPHARPGERKLAEGDLVVLDFGGVYDSYCVDLTRTVSIGAASPRMREV
jgi:Xaa-Pro aminopeptidase